jgi:hypothetical protein
VDAPAGDRRRSNWPASHRPGITATDVVLALTEFLRKQKVVGAYLEFRGEGAAALTSAIAPRSRTWRPSTAPPRRCSSSTADP